MYYDFNLNEKSFEALFELLQKDQLDENFCFDNLEKTFVHFDVKNKFSKTTCIFNKDLKINICILLFCRLFLKII